MTRLRDLLRRSALACAASALLALPVSAERAASVALDYSSNYFWRGFSFYGDASAARDAFFPWVRASWNDLSLTVAGELPQTMQGGAPNTTEMAWVGVDFISSGSTSVLPGTGPLPVAR
jgi:hypothetical protein